MISPSKIKKLKTYNGSSFQVLSVYLGADSVQAPSREYLLTQLHSLVHSQLDKEMRTVFESDIQRIEDYLSDYIPKAKSLVFFSAGDDLWEVVDLEFSVPASLSVDTSPYLQPLMGPLKEHSLYLVLLVDREKARMFTVEQGVITDRSEFVGGYVPQNVQSTGRESMKSQTDTNFRHNETMLDRHIDLAIEAVKEFTRGHDVHFVILGGHEEMFRRVAEALPPNLQARVAGTFVTDVNIPLNDIMLKSKELIAEINE
jgi:peptide subunit release factor 1 (eRF1)